MWLLSNQLHVFRFSSKPSVNLFIQSVNKILECAKAMNYSIRGASVSLPAIRWVKSSAQSKYDALCTTFYTETATHDLGSQWVGYCLCNGLMAKFLYRSTVEKTKTVSTVYTTRSPIPLTVLFIRNLQVDVLFPSLQTREAARSARNAPSAAACWNKVR